jgi:hypothetical protein
MANSDPIFAGLQRPLIDFGSASLIALQLRFSSSAPALVQAFSTIAG